MTVATPEPSNIGKVRMMFDLGDGTLLMVATDNISTYDVVHPTPIPGKGMFLTGLSEFWFTQGETSRVVGNHFITTDLSSYPMWVQQFQGRGMVVRKLDIFSVECIVRGYITGSGWKDYQRTGEICGISLPEGMLESEQFTTPLFTPSTKADVGHDENIDFEGMVKLLGGDRETAEYLRDISIALYQAGADHARRCGVILADTKFEFGRDANGVIRVGDEVLTSDSSRFWPLEGYEPGRGQPSFDKQYVRDWAAGTGWNKKPPAPAIPSDIVAGTRERYREAGLLLTGSDLLA